MKATTTLLTKKHLKTQFYFRATPARISRPLAHLLTRHACLWAALVVLATLAFRPHPARAAVTEAWVHRYNNVASNSQDQAFKVVRDAADNIIVAGSTDDGITGSDMLTIKYSGIDGPPLWQKRYNGPGNESDYPSALAVDGSGNVVMTGRSSNGTNYNFYYTAKYAAADGALLWEKRYNGPANGHDSVRTSRSLALSPNGMMAVTGSSSGDFATVVYRDDVYPISIALIPTGIRLHFTAAPGRSYNIERSLAVTGPWTIINRQSAPASGLLEYLDAPPPAGQAFYRTAQP